MRLAKNIAVSESGFLFNPSSGDSFSCNQVAADVINLLKEGKTSYQIKKAITLKYEVDTSDFERDLQDFWMQMKDNNLLNGEVIV
jgi:Coenzyme PQQ synthesis protein D (PqqD)